MKVEEFGFGFPPRLFGVRRENVLCGNGGDALLSLATRAFAGQGDAIAARRPVDES